jgi:hypothetical protein
MNSLVGVLTIVNIILPTPVYHSSDCNFNSV